MDFVHQTACRINEALNFRIEDIDNEKNLITLWTRKSKNSNLTFRRIPIPDCLLGMQKKGKLPRSGRVFSQWNTHPKFIEKAIRDYNKWGVDPDTVTNLPKIFEHLPAWSWHNLRHKRASEWATSGMPIIEIMYRLGHQNLSTTQQYLQLLGFFEFTDRFDYGEFRHNSLEEDQDETSDF